jgi:SAM-dependent methyltransferase
LKKLNLGCAYKILPGYVNLDIHKHDGVDVVHDLNKFPYPLKDNEFDEILASHILEHVDDMPKVMKELHRILKPGGRLVIRGPHFSGEGSWVDPTHKRNFTAGTFSFFCPRNADGLEEIYFDFSFRKFQSKLTFRKAWYYPWNYIIEPLMNLKPYYYENTFLRGLFPAYEVVAVLTK